MFRECPFGLSLKIYPIILAVALICETTTAGEKESSKGGFQVPVSPPRAHYIIECRIDTAARRLTGTEVIHFTNETSRPIARLAVDWSLSSRQTLKIVTRGSVVPVIEDSGVDDGDLGVDGVVDPEST